MSPPESHLPPSPPPRLAQLAPPQPSLIKHKSWSPDLSREEVWIRRKGNHNQRQHTRRKSVTDEDLDELKGCIELGFGFEFESSEIEPRLSDALPALNFYHAVNKRYHDTVFKSLPPSPSSCSTSSSSSSSSECDSPLPVCSPDAIFCSGDNPQMVKTRLRQWAQVVACSVRQSS